MFSAVITASLPAPIVPLPLSRPRLSSTRRLPPAPAFATACTMPPALLRLSARKVSAPPLACSKPLRLSAAPVLCTFNPRAETEPPMLLRPATVSAASPAAAIAPPWLFNAPLASRCSCPCVRMRPLLLPSALRLVTDRTPVPACSMRPCEFSRLAAVMVRSCALLASVPPVLSIAPPMLTRVSPLPLCTNRPPALLRLAPSILNWLACIWPATALRRPLSMLPPACTVSVPPASRSPPR
ncbi:hypothetical protein CPBF1521_39190 [Xanthomonas arboricola pv. juglandis]|nr:hypothetical protein CPBF1521_39190 [Xanthomonas arboricola pv. juglandis]